MEEGMTAKFQKQHLRRPRHPSCCYHGTSCSADTVSPHRNTFTDASKHRLGNTAPSLWCCYADKQLEDLSVCGHKKQREAPWSRGSRLICLLCGHAVDFNATKAPASSTRAPLATIKQPHCKHHWRLNPVSSSARKDLEVQRRFYENFY